MYGQDEINVIYCDSLNDIQQEIGGKVVLVEEETFDILVANPPFAVDGFLTTLPQDKRADYTLFNKDMDIKTQNNIQCFFIERAAQLLAPNGIAAIIVPSSVLSNSDATHVGSREILLKYFDVVALVELGSGTFGKTGTNTVVLFLRRKHRRPIEAEQYFNRVNDWFYHWHEELSSEGGAYQDIGFVRNYCKHINIAFEQYETLLNGNPSADLLATEIFVDYKNHFNKSNEITKLKEQKAFKAKSEFEKQSELDKRFLSYLQVIEKDKLYYFILAFTNPKKVLVIKSPADSKEQKTFLGYSWSDRRGAEGIQLVTDSEGNHLTHLYDITNRNNPEKINFLIAQSFLNAAIEIPDVLQPYASQVNLVDMLDFSRKDFDKTISITDKKMLVIETKWDLVKLGEIIQTIESGNRPQGGVGNIDAGAWSLGGEHIHATKGKIDLTTPKYVPFEFFEKSKKGILQENDILLCKDGALTGKIALLRSELVNQKAMINEHIFILRCENLITQKYIFYFLFSDVGQSLLKLNITGSAQGGLNSTNLKEIKVPLPNDLNIQEKIVSECEAIDKKVENSEQIIINSQVEIQNKIKSVESEKIISLENSGLTIIDGDRGFNYPKKQAFSDTGYCLFLNAGNIVNNKFVFDSCDFISKERDDLLRKGKLTREDIILTTRGTLGKVSYYHKHIPYEHIRINSGMVIFRNNTRHLDTAFVYEILRSLFVQSQIVDLKTGSSQPQLPIRDINKIKIPIPDLETQKTLVAEIEILETKIAAAQKIIDEAAAKKQAILKNYL